MCRHMFSQQQISDVTQHTYVLLFDFIILLNINILKIIIFIYLINLLLFYII